MKQTQPIRMCVSCRCREAQTRLLRLKLEGKEVVAYQGNGRSFYLCSVCSRNQKKIKGLSKRFGVDEEQFLKLLEELTDNG
jgi:predicted RNA-binding protein YlxR (DUF448 family)